MGSESSIKKILFGSIRKKLILSFGILAILLVILVFLTYGLNKQISNDEAYLREINVPLELMVEQVIGYDAILTGNAHEALLHAEKKEFTKVDEHKAEYDEIGLKLDNLLKFEARTLLNLSRRSWENKEKVYGYLEELDKLNLALVDLEMGAFDAMKKGDVETARSLIVTDEYEEYKKQLAEIYKKWHDEEARIAEQYRERVLVTSRNVEIYNLGLGILFIIIASIIPFIVIKNISVPVKQLTEATIEIEKGNLKARTDIKTGDEIEELSRAFNSAADKIERIEEERKQIDKAKTEFLSITSHELRSPMTPMKAQLQMLLGNYFGILNKKQKDAMDIVLRNTERLDKIIVDFLEISRIEAARLKFNFIKVNLADYIKRLKEEMDNFLPEKKIELVLKVGKLPAIEVDPDRVMQVLRNLVNNAKKFSPENSKIFITAELKNKMILFSVKDQGVGIAKNSQARIFEPFFQTDNMYQHKSGGTGLGLAICKGIVESQNGRIWFNSAEGKGTIFYFTIPLEPVRDIKPIKVLFSPVQDMEKKIKEIFIEMLGPLGATEFEDKKQEGLIEKNLLDYVQFLKRNGVINNTEEFKNRISQVFTTEAAPKEAETRNKVKRISGKDISKFIKRR